jgi:hypothetical protein
LVLMSCSGEALEVFRARAARSAMLKTIAGGAGCAVPSALFFLPGSSGGE